MDNDMLTDRDTTEQDSLSQDLVFDLLSNPRRRFILYYLRTESDPVKLTDLADKVAAWEYETPVEELTEQEKKRAYVSLYQTHVPKLAEAGLVNYDTDSGLLRPTSQTQTVDEYLPGEGSRDIRWALLYFSITIIGSVVFSIGLSDASVFDVISVSLSGAVILIMFASTAVIHFLSVRRREQQLPIELTGNNTQ